MIFRDLHAAVVPVRDLAAAREWYEGVLELSLKREVPGMLAVYGMSGPTHLCVYTAQPGEEPGYRGGGAFPNWRAENAEETHALLVSRGVKCTDVSAAPEIRWFSFFDPDGNRHDVCEYGPDWLPE